MRRDEFGIMSTSAGGFEFWQQDPVPEWIMQDGGYCVAKLTVNTTSKRVEDYSGVKQYRISKRHEIIVSLRTSAGYIDVEWSGYGNLRVVFEEIAKAFKSDYLWMDAEWQLRQKASAAGVPEYKILNIQWPSRPTSFESKVRDLLGLLNEQERVSEIAQENA